VTPPVEFGNISAGDHKEESGLGMLRRRITALKGILGGSVVGCPRKRVNHDDGSHVRRASSTCLSIPAGSKAGIK